MGVPAEVEVGRFLDAGRVAVDVEVGSRKRLLEVMARLATTGAEVLEGDVDGVLRVLTQREKLGSTGIGGGIALPHGRIDGLAEPVMAAARLKEGVEYDAPDGEAVWLVVCLLVPVDADEMHLRLLGALAARFERPGFVGRLKGAGSAGELAACLRGEG